MLKLLSVSLRLQSLIDWLVSVDDEGDYDIYEDEVGHLHETDEEYENGWIGRGEDNPKHVHDILPVVLPHQPEQSVYRHEIVIEVQVKPVSLNSICCVFFNKQGQLWFTHFAPEHFKS